MTGTMMLASPHMTGECHCVMTDVCVMTDICHDKCQVSVSMSFEMVPLSVLTINMKIGHVV